MIVDISLQITSDLFDEEEVITHPELEDGFAWFTWKTMGMENWLEKGVSIVDALAYLVLPSNLPDMIDMPDDLGDDL